MYDSDEVGNYRDGGLTYSEDTAYWFLKGIGWDPKCTTMIRSKEIEHSLDFKCSNNRLVESKCGSDGLHLNQLIHIVNANRAGFDVYIVEINKEGNEVIDFFKIDIIIEQIFLDVLVKDKGCTRKLLH